MPKQRGKGERRLDDALTALASALEAAQVPWMVIGGIAVIARGVRRLTTDVDVVVRGDSVTVTSLLRTLAAHDVEPRIEDAAAFASRNLVLLLRHVPSGVDLDLSFGWTAFELEAIEASTKAAFGSKSLPMARAEDLIVFKAMAARPKDIEDAAALMLMHSDVDLSRIRVRLAELAELADEPVLAEGLEQIIARARMARARAMRTPRPIKKAPAKKKRKPKT